MKRSAKSDHETCHNYDSHFPARPVQPDFGLGPRQVHDLDHEINRYPRYPLDQGSRVGLGDAFGDNADLELGIYVGAHARHNLYLVLTDRAVEASDLTIRIVDFIHV